MIRGTINLVFMEHPQLKEMMRNDLLNVAMDSWEGLNQ